VHVSCPLTASDGPLTSLGDGSLQRHSAVPALVRQRAGTGARPPGSYGALPCSVVVSPVSGGLGPPAPPPRSASLPLRRVGSRSPASRVTRAVERQDREHGADELVMAMQWHANWMRLLALVCFHLRNSNPGESPVRNGHPTGSWLMLPSPRGECGG